jgi:hypothetical protein
VLTVNTITDKGQANSTFHLLNAIKGDPLLNG